MLLPGRYKGTRRRAYWKPRTLEEIMGDNFKIDCRLLDFTDGERLSMTKFAGKSEDASAPILSAEFWKKGTKISGQVVRSFKTNNGICYTIQLLSKISVNRANTYPKAKGTEDLDKVSVGSLKGFEMALQASGVPEGKLLFGDKVVIICTGRTPSGKGNDQVDFEIEVNRNEF